MAIFKTTNATSVSSMLNMLNIEQVVLRVGRKRYEEQQGIDIIDRGRCVLVCTGSCRGMLQRIELGGYEQRVGQLGVGIICGDAIERFCFKRNFHQPIGKLGKRCIGVGEIRQRELDRFQAGGR